MLQSGFLSVYDDVNRCQIMFSIIFNHPVFTSPALILFNSTNFSSGSPLVMHHPSLYHSPVPGYPPTSFPPGVAGFPTSGTEY